MAEDALRGLGQEIVYGWHYLIDRPGLLGLNIVSYVHDFFVNAALVLMVPMVLSFAGANEAGAVLASGGAGLLIGSPLMSAWGGPERRVPLFLGAVAFNGVALVVAGSSPQVARIATGNFLFFLGFSAMAVCLRLILQRKVPPSVQGRVFGVPTRCATSVSGAGTDGRPRLAPSGGAIPVIEKSQQTNRRISAVLQRVPAR